MAQGIDHAFRSPKANKRTKRNVLGAMFWLVVVSFVAAAAWGYQGAASFLCFVGFGLFVAWSALSDGGKRHGGQASYGISPGGGGGGFGGGGGGGGGAGGCGGGGGC